MFFLIEYNANGFFIRDAVFGKIPLGGFPLTNKDKLDPSSIEKVIFNPPATIVLFKDGSKTVVKTTKGDKFDHELGFLYAMAKHIFPRRNQFKKFIEKWKEESKKKKNKEREK